MGASFPAAVVEVLAVETAQAAREFGAACVLLSGGVSANTALRTAMRSRVAGPVLSLPPVLCTDNAAMIAAAGAYRYQAGVRGTLDLDVDPGARLV